MEDMTLRNSDGSWLWPTLSPGQMNTVAMRGQTLATSNESTLLLYRGRLYEQRGHTVERWSGEPYKF
jgi:hypothetical protein